MKQIKHYKYKFMHNSNLALKINKWHASFNKYLIDMAI